MADEERLLSVASAVAEGSDVNWEDVEERALDGRDRSVVRALRLLSEIAEVARNPSSRRTAEQPAAPPPPATWGHLRIINQIGQGAFGSVYRAWDATLEREVALKLMRESSARGEFSPSSALKEARRLARVRHPNVVTIFGADCHDGRFGLWMELIEGCTFSEVLVAQGRLSAQEAAAVGSDLCHALAAVHRARLLHGDIKASNVMREDGGRVVLMDFGAGRRIPFSGEHTQQLAGTPLYLAPELLAGRNASVASDIYSLGVLMFQLVTGRFPVEGKTRADLALAHQRGERVSLVDARPNLPRAFIEVVDRALASSPTDRYGTAGQFGSALADAVGARYQRDPLAVPYWKAVAAATVAIALLLGVAQVGRRTLAGPTEQVSPAPLGEKVGSGGSASTARATYQITASFYALREGQEVRLTAGSRVAPGDQLLVSIEASQPVFVYVVNQDDMGKSYLLFPLTDVAPGNPIPVGRTNRLPGARNGQELYWQVTSVGGREHFLVYVSPDRLTEFETLLAALPRPQIGRPVESVVLPEPAVLALRGVGGLAPAEGSTAIRPLGLTELQELPDAKEVVSGVWARRITLENPVR